MNISNIIIGTVQFGIPYGLNQTLPTEKDTFRILDRAWELGIRRFDTARGYGLAEERLGKWIRSRPGLLPMVTTKFPDGDLAAVRSNILKSYALLGHDTIECLMAHDHKTLRLPGILDLLTSYEIGEKRLGASVYEADEAWQCVERLGARCDVQAPLNPLDTRIVDAGFPGNHSDVRLVCRSIYLQGVIGIAPRALPTHLKPLGPALEVLKKSASEMGLGPHAFAISFVRHVLGAQSLVLGVARENHLEEILRGIAAPAPPPDTARSLRESLKGLANSLLDPRQWPSGP